MRLSIQETAGELFVFQVQLFQFFNFVCRCMLLFKSIYFRPRQSKWQMGKISSAAQWIV